MSEFAPTLSPCVIVDMSGSPFARLRPVPVDAVRLADTFWKPRCDANRLSTIPSQYRQCKETGRLDNFRRAAGLIDQPFQGIFFNDSDVYKWLEAASWALAGAEGSSGLRPMIDEAIGVIAAAQQPDGYLNTYFSRERARERWSNLRDMHELYCAGHLFQAAVAHNRVTGETGLLDVATRFADYLCDYFGPPAAGRHAGACGHEEVEMALVELYRLTGRRRYLELATYFTGARGAAPSALTKEGDNDDFDRRYAQDHVPYTELAEATGHAVRMVYLTCGAADVYAETGDPLIKEALARQWDNMTGRRMYVTGGLGALWEGEAFGVDYQLPNATAYAETCAAIGGMMWNWRMLLATGEPKYIDILELELYNAALAGLSLDNERYFYQNPLADNGGHRRQAWFGCACCPPNVARLLAQLPGYFYAVFDSAVHINLYAQGSADLALPDGRRVRLTQKTRYPWDGDVSMTVHTDGEFTLFLHVPSWVEDEIVLELLTGSEPAAPLPGGDSRPVGVHRHWKAGDTVHMVLPMPVRRLYSHPWVADTQGQIALMRGPLVYCLEQADNPGIDLQQITLAADAALTAVWEPDLLGGVVVLHSDGVETTPGGLIGRMVTAIPYYAWANREAGALRVWVPAGDDSQTAPAL